MLESFVDFRILRRIDYNNCSEDVSVCSVLRESGDYEGMFV